MILCWSFVPYSLSTSRLLLAYMFRILIHISDCPLCLSWPSSMTWLQLIYKLKVPNVFNSKWFIFLVRIFLWNRSRIHSVFLFSRPRLSANGVSGCHFFELQQPSFEVGNNWIETNKVRVSQGNGYIRKEFWERD